MRCACAEPTITAGEIRALADAVSRYLCWQARQLELRESKRRLH